MDLDLVYDEPSVVEKPSSKKKRRRLSRWTIFKIVFALSCVGALFATLVQAVGAAREAARRSQCTCNLCGIRLALLNYHDTYKTFPPAYLADASGRPMHSWRVLILPWLERSDLYNQYNFGEPWDGPNNIKLLNSIPPVYACPSWHDSTTTLTSYVAVTGPGTIFPGERTTRNEDITDGTSNTLIVLEVANVKIPWTAPQDLDVRTMSLRINDPKRPGISSKHPGGANVVFADASTRFVHESIAPEKLRALFTIAGGEGITADQALDSK
jgi:prepilin-type processing-associated H-X9-DG protein